MSGAKDLVLESKFTWENRSLWFGQIRLYRDEIVATGWGWTGQTAERLPIEEIGMVEKWTVALGANFRVRTSSGRVAIFGRIHQGAKFWELTLEKDSRVDLRLRH